ncbi:DUF5026 domain-containing protein [Lachnospiraceae bacterium ZAX-1]
MALIVDTAVKAFDLTQIHRGDCIRVKRNGDTTAKNGFVTKVGEKQIEILYCNTQNNATSYLPILAVDVAIGMWEIWWTTDFATINVENDAPPME